MFNFELSSPTGALMAAATFGLILALWLIGVSLWSMRRRARSEKLQKRLDPSAGPSFEARTLRISESAWSSSGRTRSHDSEAA